VGPRRLTTAPVRSTGRPAGEVIPATQRECAVWVLEGNQRWPVLTCSGRACRATRIAEDRLRHESRRMCRPPLDAGDRRALCPRRAKCASQPLPQDEVGRIKPSMRQWPERSEGHLLRAKRGAVEGLLPNRPAATKTVDHLLDRVTTDRDRQAIHRIVRAARHMTRQIGPTLQHLPGRRPVRPTRACRSPG
jgi:hypothetical protein